MTRVVPEVQQAVSRAQHAAQAWATMRTLVLDDELATLSRILLVLSADAE